MLASCREAGSLMHAVESATPLCQPPPRSRPPAGGPWSPLTPILGRDAEIAAVISLLDRDDLRVVTLLGPGGVGKTRLAWEVVRTMSSSFAHGSVFVPLASIRDPALVPNAVAQALDVRESVDRPVADVLAELLTDRHVLLVLDNLEQVIGAACPWLADLLHRAPRVRVLVTSRIPLHIDGEQQFVVPPLPTEALQPHDSAAVVLFAQRAKTVNHAFVLDDPSAATIAEICRRLDGLPLAIELAAARTKILSLPALLARLTDRLPVLTGGRQDVPRRLRSMRDAIAWSYELLSEDEQHLLRRLSVFLGGFPLDAAAFVRAWPDPPAADQSAIALVHSLVDQSLLQSVPGTHEPHFRFLETIREFGVAEARAHGEEQIAQQARAEYVRSVAARAEVALTGPDQAAWLDRLETDYPNIRAAVAWLEDQGRISDAIETLSQIQFFLNLRGHTSETLERLESWMRRPALERASRSRGLLLLGLGGLLQNTGDFARSIALLSEAAPMLQASGDRRHAAVAFGILGASYAMASDYDRMVPAIEASLALAQPLGLHRFVSAGLYFLAAQARSVGQPARARALHQQAYEVARQGGDRWRLAFELAERAEAALRHGSLDEAERLARESVDAFETLGSRRDLPWAWGLMAEIARQGGDRDAAVERLAAGIAIAEACGHTARVAELKLRKGIVDIERRHVREASRALADALTTFEDRHLLVDIGRCLEAYTHLAADTGDSIQAARFLGAFDALNLPVTASSGDLGPVADGCRTREMLRAKLGEAEFTQGYQDGRALSAADAVTLALAYTPTAPPSRDDPAQRTGVSLSPREREVLGYMANGLSNQQIADTLFLSVRTVTSHVTSILTKLGVESRTAAVAYAIRAGLA